MVKYLWQHKNWTQFSWDSDKIITHLAKARKAQGVLQAHASTIELYDLSELITDEVVNTLEIEGEKIDRNSVRSSVAVRLGISTAGLSPATIRSEALVDLLMDATGNYQAKLTKKRLCGWQAALFPTGYSGMSKIIVGNYRAGTEQMRVLSGRIGGEAVHYQAPPSRNVSIEMDKFIKWWNLSTDMDGIIRAAIAHLWFVTIHPFDDGNGRVARVITDMALAQDEKTSKRLYSLSKQIMIERKGYYEILERTQKGNGDITEWLIWFLSTFKQAIGDSKKLIEKSLFMNKYYKFISGIYLSKRQSKVIKKLIEHYPKGFEGGLTNKKYVSIAKTSPESAKRDIKDLLDKKIILKNEGRGRSTSYRLNLEV